MDTNSRIRRGRPVVSVGIGVFVAAQGLIPLRGVVFGGHATRADFSWRMYSHSYQCTASYSGPDGPLDAALALKRRADLPLLLHRDALAAWHPWLCAHQRPLTASLQCAADFGPPLVLAAPDRPLCPLR